MIDGVDEAMAELLSALRTISHEIYNIKKISDSDENSPRSDLPDDQISKDMLTAFAYRRKIWRDSSLKGDFRKDKRSSFRKFSQFIESNLSFNPNGKRRGQFYKQSEFKFKFARRNHHVMIINLLYKIQMTIPEQFGSWQIISSMKSIHCGIERGQKTNLSNLKS